MQSPANNWNLVSQFNPLIGRAQWKLVDPDYDYAQEIARSGYGDMLHDADRNHKYRLAIERAIEHRRSGLPVSPIHVLDIGTGTGLLAMMASRAGADHITACEAFRPVAQCAQSVLHDNGFGEKIHLVGKRSNQLVIGKDMPERANLLVAELLDTELIGEAALATYRHAAECLLTEDATLVPYAADLFVQVVESPFLWCHHRLSSFDSDSQLSLERFHDALLDETVLSCPGAPSVFDIQASELDLVPPDYEGPLHHSDRQIRCLLSQPLFVKRFHFAPPADQIKLEASFDILHFPNGEPIRAVHSGTIHAFIVWWNLKMEPTNTVPDITTAPIWAGDPNYAWRDHWMQAVFFPSHSVHVDRNESFGVRFSHDSLSLWFDVSPSPSGGRIVPPSSRPVCVCGMHYAWSRTRIAHLNSDNYRALMSNILTHLRSTLSSHTSPVAGIDLVVISDCSLLPLLVANFVSKLKCPYPVHTRHIDSSACSARFLRSIYQHDPTSYSDITVFESISQFIDDYKLINENRATAAPTSLIVLAEPHSAAGLLPWESLSFWYAHHELVTKLTIPASDHHLLCPTRMRIWAVLVEFDNLCKIRAPIGRKCEGFDLSNFDHLIQAAMSKTDAVIEPQPLWEYPCRARSQLTKVFDLDLVSVQSFDPNTFTCCQDTVLEPLSFPYNGIAFWADWLILPSDVCSASEKEFWYAPAGPSHAVCVNQLIRWDALGTQQGVYFIPHFTPNDVKGNSPSPVHVKVHFDGSTGAHTFEINLLHN